MLWKVSLRSSLLHKQRPDGCAGGVFSNEYSVVGFFFFFFFFFGESCISSFYSLELFCVCRLDIVFIHLIFLCLEGRVKWYWYFHV